MKNGIKWVVLQYGKENHDALAINPTRRISSALKLFQKIDNFKINLYVFM